MAINVFHTLTFSLRKPDFFLEVKNLEVANGHWGSEKNILRFVSELENLYTLQHQDLDTVNKLIPSLFIKLFKENPKMDELIFYQDHCLLISDIRTFTKENYLNRKIELTFPKYNLSFNLNEITKKEREEEKLPEEWSLDEKRTREFERYKSLFIE